VSPDPGGIWTVVPLLGLLLFGLACAVTDRMRQRRAGRR
jgi:hypothetical protein